MGDVSYYDISDSQCHEICESYLTSSQFEDMFSDWSERDKPENDWIKSDNEVNVLDMDCSESDRSERKRKSSELPRYNKVRVIVPNPQFNAENNIESSILFRPWEDRNQFGAGRGEAEKNPKQVEPEKEKNPQQGESEKEKNPQQMEPERDSDEVEQQAETDKEQGEETKSFKNRFYTITFEPSNTRDINRTWEKYKSRIKAKVESNMHRNITFDLVYKVRLVRSNDGGVERHLHNFNICNRRLLNIEEFDQEYRWHMDKINEELENFTGQGSGWVLEEIESVFIEISRYKPIRRGSYIPTP